MRTVDREGVHLEQCQSCHGIFLDHGELERILAAEQRYYEPAQYQPPDAGHPASPGYHPDSPRPYGHHPDSPSPFGHRGHRRRSFLEGLFG